ncbi:glutathione hydrolase 6 isoform d [Homo sapiens]|nr:glutathione hydrolase 6 isoform d [Homo sapiens]XP_047291293.1 glutathione hydrolase 6 isoform X5 [Homo sapiens]|eukprot:NP_001275632.1 glutathione hydrolase 6 isoform d [Homo sapiens]
MERAEEPVVYQKLLPWEPSLESEEEVEEEETSEALVLNPRRHQDSSRNKAGGLPGTWARVVAALLLLAVGCSLAVRQLQNQGRSTGSLGSVAPPPGGHSHGPGVYHHGAIISPAGRELLVAGGNVVDAGVGAALCLAVVHPHATGLDCCEPREQCPGRRGQQRLCAPSHLLAQLLLWLCTPVPKHWGSAQQPGGQVYH